MIQGMLSISDKYDSVNECTQEISELMKLHIQRVWQNGHKFMRQLAHDSNNSNSSSSTDNNNNDNNNNNNCCYYQRGWCSRWGQYDSLYLPQPVLLPYQVAT